MNLTQQRFLGYQNTPILWEGYMCGIEQLELHTKCSPPTHKIEDTGRLGNYVERLVSYELSQKAGIEITEENLQIIEDKITLGELDCLLKVNNHPIHLEIAFKFYLYDASVGNQFLDHWIGPNRRDSLVLKLDKIKTKQFPLLDTKACKKVLSDLNINFQEIEQKSLFKAQLYLPYGMDLRLDPFKSDSLKGYYIYTNQLQDFKLCKFYFPKKLDWLIEPHPDVDWLTYESAKIRIEEFHQKKSSPLSWLKHPNGEIEKVFIVNW